MKYTVDIQPIIPRPRIGRTAAAEVRRRRLGDLTPEEQAEIQAEEETFRKQERLIEKAYRVLDDFIREQNQ
jgi:hypothetical protein